MNRLFGLYASANILLLSLERHGGLEMMNLSIENSLMKERTIRDSRVAAGSKRHWSIGIGLFFTLGIVTMFAGLILAAESYLGLVIESDLIGNVSAFLLIVSFPLLSLGAHSMDMVAAIELEAREAKPGVDDKENSLGERSS